MTPMEKLNAKADRLKRRAPKLNEAAIAALIEAVVHVAENGDMRANAQFCFVCKQTMEKVDAAMAKVEAS